MSWSDKEFGFQTRAIHAGQIPDPSYGSIMTPIHLASTFVQESPGEHKGFDYSRAGNPTREAFEKCLANLENGKYGFAFSSGCSATATLAHLLKSGDHLICMDDVYGGTYRLFEQVIKNNGIEISFVDLTDIENLKSEIKPNTKMIWLESPTNPLLKMVDFELITNEAKKHSVLTVADNTFMSPYFQRPLDHGVDITYHSTTKYIGGHSDVIGGAVITNNKEVADKIYFLQKSIGAVSSPFDSYMALRSLKTLPLRMKTHEMNAQKIAEFLEKHEHVEKVLYPGLESHPQHSLVKKQMHGTGGMITFFIKGGLPAAKTFLENVKVFALAESLGGVESLIEHPAIMTHASVPAEIRRELGIEDTLIRLSVGIEDVQDLIKDLENAFMSVNQ